MRLANDRENDLEFTCGWEAVTGAGASREKGGYRRRQGAIR